MGQRNMLCTRQMLDMELEQGQSHHPEPCIHFGNVVDYPNPNMHPVLSTPANSTLDLCHFPEHHESSIFYGNQYNILQHQPPVVNLDLSGAASSNFPYNPCMIPSSASRISHLPVDRSESNHTSSANNHAVNGINVDDYGRNNHFMDNARGSCKRKNAEEFPGNDYYVNGSSSSSSSSMSVSLNPDPQQLEESFEPRAGVLDATVLTPPEYRGNGNLSITEGSQRSVRSRSTSAINLQLDSVLAHHHNHLVQGNYIGQSVQPSNNAWTEPSGSTRGDGGTYNWNYAPAMPYLRGRNVNGGLEIGSVGGHGYRDSNGNSAILLRPPPMHHHHHPTLMQGMPVHSYSYHPQIQIPPYRHQTNSSLHEGALNSSLEGLESVSRYPRSLSSSGDRMYRSHRRGPQVASEDINGRMRFLSSEDVAILEFSGFYGAGNFIDQHRDMRLDIDDMSYEELLALEERIGDVSTGLAEETISKCLKTRQHVSCAASFPPEQSEDMARENETCIICQVEYEENEKIGTLVCGHKYHADCIKQWLLVKNVCPICKMSALPVDKREG